MFLQARRAFMPETRRPASLSPRLALGALLALGLLAGPSAALLGLVAPPGGDGPVIAVAPPWTDLDAIVEAAGGRPVGPVAAPAAVTAAGPDESFSARLTAAGAWLALDGRRVAQLCGAAG
jgi:hypothetical protein